MKNDILSIAVIVAALLINIFLITAVYYAKNKGDTRFGQFSKDLDKLINKEISEVKDLFTKKKK